MPASETEVARMVARLIGDGSSYQAMMEQAAHSSEQTARTVGEAAEHIESMEGRLKEFAHIAVESLEALGATEFLHKSFDAYSEMETAQLRLGALVRTNGDAAQETMRQYDELAETLSRTTTISKRQALATLEQAEAMGKTGAAAEQLAEQAAAFGAITGRSAQESIHLAMAYETGNVQMLRFALGLRHAGQDVDVMAIANKRLQAGQELLSKELETGAGALKMLANAWEALEESLGGFVAQAVLPVVQGFREALAYLTALPPEVKLLGVIAAGVAAAFLAIGPAMAIVSVLWAGLSSVLLPVGLIAAGLWGIVESLGGVEGAWKAAQAAGTAFLEWVRPIWTAIASLAQDAWEMIVEGAKWLWSEIQSIFNTLWRYVVGVWDRITGGARVSWTDIRDTIRDAILFAEFTLHNFQQVAEYVWAGIKLYAVEALNLILNNIMLILAGPPLLAVYAVMQINWGKLWDWFLEKAKSVLNKIWDGLRLLWMAMKNPAAAFTGVGMLAVESWKKVVEMNITADWKGVHIGALDDLQAQLQADFDKQGAALHESFAAFKADWLAKHAEQVKAVAKELDNQTMAMAQTSAHGLAKEAHKWEAVAFGSAEALSRVIESHRAITSGDVGTSGQAVGLAAVAASSAASVAEHRNGNKILSDMRDMMRDGKGGMKIMPAMLG